MKVLKPKSWDELEKAAEEAKWKWIAVDGRDLPLSSVCVPKKRLRLENPLEEPFLFFVRMSNGFDLEDVPSFHQMNRKTR